MMPDYIPQWVEDIYWWLTKPIRIIQNKFRKPVFQPFTVVRLSDMAQKFYDAHEQETAQSDKPFRHPLRLDDRAIYVNEIRNMPGHCILILQDGSIEQGWHTADFDEVPEDEI